MEGFEVILYTIKSGKVPVADFIDSVDEKMQDDFDKLLEKHMQNPSFRCEYEALQPEATIIQSMIDARKKCNLTQKKLAEKTEINQADISKLETGNANPTVLILKRLAEAMDMHLKIEFVSNRLIKN